MRKLFQLVTHFKSTINRHLIQKDWLLKTRNHLEKLEKKLKQKKLKKLRKLCKDNSNLHFACLTRVDSHDEFFDFKHYFFKFCNSFVPDSENLHYLNHLNDSMSGTLVDSNSDEEIALDITGFHDEKVLNKQSLTACDRSESHLNEEGNDALNGRIKGKFVSENVVNLSKRKLTKAEISLLSKGLKFVPTSNHINKAKLKMELEAYGRMLRLKWEERSALYNLKNDKNIVIKSADKGSAVVVWDRDDYIKEAEKQLGDKEIYEEMCNDPEPLISTIHNAIKKIRLRGDLSADTIKYFMVKDPKFARFYLLPKIQKRLYDVPGRPVISNCGYYTENISSFLDFHLQPLTREVKSYIKDTNDFLKKLRSLPNLPDDIILCTVDVVGLYLNIPHEEGLSVRSA